MIMAMGALNSKNSYKHFQLLHEENLKTSLNVSFHEKLIEIMNILGAFRLYDLDNDGTITKTEMTQIVEAIFSMVGNQKDQMPNEARGFNDYYRWYHI